MDWAMLLEKLLLVLITVGLPVLLRWLFGDVLTALVDYYNARVDERVRVEIAWLVRQAVDAAEQLGLSGQLQQIGKTKFEYAVDCVEAWLAQRGLDMDLTELEAAIEAEVIRAYGHLER